MVTSGGGSGAGAHVLVVGGTGILRTAVEEFVRRGCEVTVVARNAVDGTQVFAARADAGDPRSIEEVLDAAISARGPFDVALVYETVASVASLEAIASRATGRLVYVLTSEWGAPDADLSGRDERTPEGAGGFTQRVILGWTYGTGGARWHTPGEIGQGTLEALDLGRDEAIIGTLRPWDERPSR